MHGLLSESGRRLTLRGDGVDQRGPTTTARSIREEDDPYARTYRPRRHACLRQASSSQIVLCDVVQTELFHGVEKSKRRQRNRGELEGFICRFASLPFDGNAARVYGRIRAELEPRGTPVGPNDLMIAAIAVANGLTLVTNHVAEFSRVDGLTIEDWTK